jgi:hypothetical protein
MTVDASLARFGLTPPSEALPQIRQLLLADTSKERSKQGSSNVGLLRLYCVQLFGAGQPADTLLVWSAKEANFDLACGIDIQLLRGAGLGATKEFLTSHSSPEARAALECIAACEQSGDFEGFTPAAHLQFYRRYYRVV